MTTRAAVARVFAIFLVAAALLVALVLFVVETPSVVELEHGVSVQQVFSRRLHSYEPSKRRYLAHLTPAHSWLLRLRQGQVKSVLPLHHTHKRLSSSVNRVRAQLEEPQLYPSNLTVSTSSRRRKDPTETRSLSILLTSAYDPSAGHTADFVLRQWKTDGTLAYLSTVHSSVKLKVESDTTLSVEHGIKSQADWKEISAKLTDTLLSREEVASVTAKHPRILLNAFHTSMGQSGVLDLASASSVPLWAKGLTGGGPGVGGAGIGDSGIDWDSCYFRSGDNTAELSVDKCDFDQRKIACYFAHVGSTEDEEPHGGHGSHTAATMAGLHYRTSSSGNPTNEELLETNLYANGHAPGAKVVFHDFGKKDGKLDVPQDMSAPGPLQEAYNLGKVRVHSNSWGCGTPQDVAPQECNIYDIQTRSVDLFQYNNMDMLVLVAAGNEGPLPETVGAPATAKNVLSIGATDDPEDLGAYSALGYTMDFRVKPDLVFGGTDIFSSESSDDSSDFSFASQCSSQRAGAGDAKLTGTSMACPAVAGMALLVRQYYLEFNPTTGERGTQDGPLSDGKGPSAALLKATLINSARGLSGDYVDVNLCFGYGGCVPQTVASAGSERTQLEGHGKPVLMNTLRFDEETSKALFIADRHQIDTQQSHTYAFLVKAGGSIKMTLVWTDRPGPTRDTFDRGSVLVNDLDLLVSCDVACPDSLSVALDNHRDNVEQLPPLEPAEFEVSTEVELQIFGYDVIEGPQPYALVVSGFEFEVLTTAEPNWIPTWTAEAVTERTAFVLGLGTIIILAMAVLVVILVITTIYFVVRWCMRTKRGGVDSAARPMHQAPANMSQQAPANMSMAESASVAPGIYAEQPPPPQPYAPSAPTGAVMAYPNPAFQPTGFGGPTYNAPPPSGPGLPPQAGGYSAAPYAPYQ